MEKLLIIRDRSKKIIFRNRKVRTPVTLTIDDSELSQLKTQIHMADIQNWKVEDVPVEDDKIVCDDFESSEIFIEELEEHEPITVLEKMMKTGECE